jgi:hypothetical protein
MPHRSAWLGLLACGLVAAPADVSREALRAGMDAMHPR